MKAFKHTLFLLLILSVVTLGSCYKEINDRGIEEVVTPVVPVEPIEKPVTPEEPVVPEVPEEVTPAEPVVKPEIEEEDFDAVVYRFQFFEGDVLIGKAAFDSAVTFGEIKTKAKVETTFDGDSSFVAWGIQDSSDVVASDEVVFTDSVNFVAVFKVGGYKTPLSLNDLADFGWYNKELGQYLIVKGGEGAPAGDFFVIEGLDYTDAARLIRQYNAAEENMYDAADAGDRVAQQKYYNQKADIEANPAFNAYMWWLTDLDADGENDTVCAMVAGFQQLKLQLNPQGNALTNIDTGDIYRRD